MVERVEQRPSVLSRGSRWRSRPGRLAGTGALALLAATACTGADAPPEPELPPLTPVMTDGATYADLEYSPDGSRMTYSRGDPDGMAIWVANADGSNPVRVSPISVYAFNPEWSFDGTWITYNSDQFGVPDVMVVPADGGEPRALMKTPFFEFYPRPSPDGTRILYTSQGSGDLWTVPVAGGTPSLLTASSTGVGGWSPDGRYIAYNRAAEGRRSVWLYSVEDGSERELTSEGYETFGGNGWSHDSSEVLVYSFRTGLPDVWAYPVDGREPRQITRDIRADNLANYSPDGRWVVFHSERGGQDDVWMVPSTGGDAIRLTNDPHEEFDIRWTPDGRGVSFIRDDNVSAVQVVDLADGSSRTVSPGRADQTFNDVSPDGRWVLYTSEPGGNDDVFVVSTDGGEARALVQSPADDFRPRWSPDGSRVVFASTRSGDERLYVIPAEGGETRPVTDLPARWAEWSPSGDRLAFVSGAGADAQVWVVPSAGGEAVQVTTLGQVDEAPVWSPDGRTLLFTVALGDGGYAVYRVPAEGGTETRISPVEFDAAQVPVWSPDGSMIAYSAYTSSEGAGSSDFNIYVSNADGSGVRRLTDDTRWDITPTWSEDGSEIYFLSQMGAETGIGSVYDLAVVSVAGGDARIVHDAPEDVGPPLRIVGGHAFFTATPIGNEMVTVDVGALLDAAGSGEGN